MGKKAEKVIMRMWRAGKSDNGGFTLLEFAVVILIIGIFLGLAFPNFQRNFNRDLLRISSVRLAESIRIVRIEAISNGQMLRIRLDLSKGSWNVEGMNAGGKWLDLQSIPIPKGHLENGVYIYKIRVDGQKDTERGEVNLIFLPSGETRSAMLYLSNMNQKSVTLVVHPFINRVKIRHGRVSI